MGERLLDSGQRAAAVGPARQLPNANHSRHDTTTVQPRAWPPRRLHRAQENQKLRELVQVYGFKSWSKVAGHFESRVGKQCRERCEPRPSRRRGCRRRHDHAAKARFVCASYLL